MKHLAFCKIGKSIKFASNFSPIGGDNEAPSMLRLLANNNPDITFHIVGRSDFYRLSYNDRIELFPYDNVRDAFEGKRGKADEDQVINYFNDLGLQPSALVLMVGQVGNVSIPNKIWGIRDPSKTVSIIDMTKNYTTPITKWLNDNTSMEVVEVCNDPRYTMRQSKDCFNNPIVSLSQYTYTYIRKHIVNYNNQEYVETEIDCKYSEVERIFQYGKVFKPATVENRNIPMMVVLNEGSPSRYNMLNEWVLKNNENVEIYGKWEHEDAVNDPRFKGSLHIDELQEKLNHVRCTFIIPIAKGWVTSKYVEMIHAGVIPFFHPTYDEQNNTPVSDWLRLKSPESLTKIVNMISTNDEVYLECIRELQELVCKPEYYDGTKLNQIVMSTIYRNYQRPSLDDFDVAERESEGLEEFF